MKTGNFISCLIIGFFAIPLQADDTDGLYKLILKDKKVVVGEILSRTDEAVEIVDMRSGKKSRIATESIDNVAIADNEGYNIRYAGVPRYLAWKISNHPSMRTTRGKIAANDSGVIYANLGENSGATVGQVFSVFSKGNEIRDPDTGEVIGDTRRKIAELKITHIEPRLSKLIRIGEMENELEIGAEIVGEPVTIAILPFANEQGMETADGRRISEDLLTKMVGQEMNVVERRLLDKVAGELGLQQGYAFDDATAVKVGKLLGADRILTGSTSLLNNGQTKYFFRLIDVQTGKVLFALTHEILIDSRSAAQSAVMPVRVTPGLNPGQVVTLSRERGVLIQAEDFSRLIEPMIVARDSRAMGGQFVHLPVSNDEGSIIFVLDVPQKGIWYLWARVMAPSTGENSCFVSFVRNGNEVTKKIGAQFPKDTMEFKWLPVHELNYSAVEDVNNPLINWPMEFRLPSGIVELHISGREPRTAIDALFISPSREIGP